MKQVLLTAALSAGIATSAAAQTMPAAALEFLDVDKDVQVTREEMMERMDLLFPGMDTDGNGQLEYAEVETFMSREIFDDADDNGNGKLSQSEYRDQVMEDFSAADLDGDGALN